MGCQSWKIATSCQAKGLLFVLCAHIYSNTCACMTYVALKNGYGHSSIYNILISKIQSYMNCSIIVIVLCAVEFAQIQHACNTYSLFHKSATVYSNGPRSLAMLKTSLAGP